MNRKTIISLAAIAAVLIAGIWTAQNIVRASDNQDTNKEAKAQLGVSITDVTKKIAKAHDLETMEGAYVNSVTWGSPASDAGLHRGDVITEVDGRSIKSADDLVQTIKGYEPGDTVSVSLIRKGQRQTLSVTLEKSKPRRLGRGIFRLKMQPGLQSRKGYMRFDVLPDNRVFRLFSGRGRLGVDVLDLNPDLGEYFGVPDGKGVLITSVNEESPAEKAGLRAGDVIVSLNGKPTEDTNDLKRVIREYDEEDAVELEVIRNGERMTISAELESFDGFSGLHILPRLESELAIISPRIMELEHHLEGLEIELEDFEIPHMEHDFIGPMIFDLKGRGILSGRIFLNLPKGLNIHLSIDEDGKVTFNDREFDTLEEFKDFLRSEEYKKYRKEMKEKMRPHEKEESPQDSSSISA